MARPREFDPDTALDAIQKTFWNKGFDGTSLHDLEAATGLKKQSLYREFGNKDTMYERALSLYRDREAAALAQIARQGETAKARVSNLFSAVLAPVRAGDRSGCFLCNAAIDHAAEDAATRDHTIKGIEATCAMFETALREFEPYLGSADLCRAMALRLAAGYFGLRVMIRAGTPLRMLEALVDDLVADV
jgi:TetR/AcrR family transcriptional repressor of nem operon